MPTAAPPRRADRVTLYTDANEAAAGADVIVTDTWVSMGKEEEKLARLRDLGEYKVTQELMSLAKPDAIFIHCLPADRGYEVEAEVIDGPQSVVWDEAENRLHAQKALLVWLLRQELSGRAAVVERAQRRERRPLGVAAWDRLNGPQRIAGVDLARGLAVIGMFAAHLLWIDDSRLRGCLHLDRRRRRALLDPVRDARRRLDRARDRGRATAAGRRAAHSREGASPCARRCCGSSASALIAHGVPVFVILPAYAILFLLALPLVSLGARTLLPARGRARRSSMPFVQVLLDAPARSGRRQSGQLVAAGDRLALPVPGVDRVRRRRPRRRPRRHPAHRACSCGCSAPAPLLAADRLRAGRRDRRRPGRRGDVVLGRGVDGARRTPAACSR